MYYPLSNEAIIPGQPLYQLAKKEVQSFPNNLIGVITGRDNDGYPLRGSGTLIAANLVLTVAHCIFEGKKYGEDYKKLRFHPAAYDTMKE